ncbi:MAG TPA: cryptochrome/photolyase family protein, partial [Pseudobdellovibrionaceae bacterium]
MKTSKGLFLIQSEQLFSTAYLKGHENDLFLMIEDRQQLTTYKFHKHKLIFYLSAMRHYAREIRRQDYNLVYLELAETDGLPYEKILERVLKESSLDKIITFEIEDKDHENKILEFCARNAYTLEIKTSPQFLVSRTHFKNYLEQHPQPFLKSFYEDQRRKLKILVEPNGEPIGGRFSFNESSHLKCPHEHGTPKFPFPGHDEIDHEVIKLVDKEFSDHPGESLTAWYPTSRKTAHKTLRDFCKYRLAEFAPYEETLCPGEDFLFHSVLSPLLNVGLLTPREVLTAAVQSTSEIPIPLNSLESFVKKIIGYREYARGIHQNFSETQEQSNFWKHFRLPNENWRLGKTEIPPLDDAIKKVLRLSYIHHTERLKIICNMMNLAEIAPLEAYLWFMEMQLDSVAWATGPNVYGMGLHSDGGIFTNDLHICKANYWLKISTYTKDEWCQEVDGLYWRFIDKHHAFFLKNPKLEAMAKTLEHITPERKEQLWRAADAFIQRNTSYP